MMIEEKLLRNWLLLSRIIKNDRIVETIPYSEALVLALLLPEYPDDVLLKNLIHDSKMLKSQINRTISSLLQKKWIEKKSCLDDRRCLKIRMTEKGFQVIEEIRQSVLQISRNIVQSIGMEDAEKLNEIFEKIIRAAEE